ncbi:hypothetical protein KNE206_53190 [Kitasatospora sp. NE20-6]|uniref:DUF317 domain-containing protein n=1 Tax=Kitasatospora sp. NE20-6 TaxID=2859066 RepID=UPI0034DC2896
MAPRHLATATHEAEPVLSRLGSARWLQGDDPVANVYMASPDLRIRVGFLPEAPGPLWQIVAGEPFGTRPAWLVTMSDETPAEIVADFASALIALHAEDQPEAYLTDRTPTDLDSVLVSAGWNNVRDDRLASDFWQSPDGYAEAHEVPGKPIPDRELAGKAGRWIINGGNDKTRWWITASSGTPTRLVAALQSAVVNPVPVRRYGSDLHHLPATATITQVAPVRGTSRAAAAHAGSALLRSVHPASTRPPGHVSAGPRTPVTNTR